MSNKVLVMSVNTTIPFLAEPELAELASMVTDPLPVPKFGDTVSQLAEVVANQAVLDVIFAGELLFAGEFNVIFLGLTDKVEAVPPTCTTINESYAPEVAVHNTFPILVAPVLELSANTFEDKFPVPFILATTSQAALSVMVQLLLVTILNDPFAPAFAVKNTVSGFITTPPGMGVV